MVKKAGVLCPTFLCAGSAHPGSQCHSGQKRPERRLLSTKSRAVPAEGVAPLTLHRLVKFRLPAFRESLSAWL